MEKKTYKIDWDSNEDGILYGVSLVNNPANQYEYIEFSEEQTKIMLADDKKKLLAGVVLVPDQKIPRFTKERGEFNIVFDKQTIEKLSHNFLSQEGFNKNNWYNHDKNNKIDNSVIVESWLLSSETQDKAIALGYKDLPLGTWCIVMKLSDDGYTEYIETGKAKGFSIDSYLKLEEIMFSDIEEEVPTKEETIKNKITQNMKNYLKEFLKFSLSKEEEKEEVKMLEIPQEEGEALTVASLEEGQMVMRGEEVISNSEFTFEGKVYKTDEAGMISQISDVEAEPEVELEEEEKKDEMSLEDQKAELFKMLDENPEIENMMKERYGKEEDKKESLEMSAKLKRENDTIKLDLEKKIEALELELENAPNTGKFKSQEINLNERKSESMIEALTRISKTVNK